MDAKEMTRVILDIIARGNTAEVKKRKNDIVVLEVERKIKKLRCQIFLLHYSLCSYLITIFHSQLWQQEA